MPDTTPFHTVTNKDIWNKLESIEISINEVKASTRTHRWAIWFLYVLVIAMMGVKIIW